MSINKYVEWKVGFTVAVTLSQSDTKARNPSPNTAPAVLKTHRYTETVRSPIVSIIMVCSVIHKVCLSIQPLVQHVFASAYSLHRVCSCLIV